MNLREQLLTVCHLRASGRADPGEADLAVYCNHLAYLNTVYAIHPISTDSACGDPVSLGSKIAPALNIYTLLVTTP